MPFRAEYYSYLKHVHAKSTRWAAWEPSDQIIEPGCVGYFGANLQFMMERQSTLAEYGVPVALSAERATPPRFYADYRDWSTGAGGGFRGPAPLHPPLVADVNGRLRIRSRGKRAWALQLRAATDCHIENDRDVFEAVRQLLVDGQWEIDDFVVTQRTRAREGFAFVCHEKGFDLDLDVGVGATLAGLHELGGADLATQLQSGAAGYSFYPFAAESAEEPADASIPTPSFSAPMGVDQALWGKLLPVGKKKGLGVISASGKRYTVPPINLKHRPLPERTYQAGAAGVMTPEEIMALPLWELFRPLEDIGWRRLIGPTIGRVLPSPKVREDLPA